ncbi:MAG: 2-C-methyl-D-erythritol 4-phosphate cytidylyltransferase [Endomicrobiales bacterium]|nr:2-C-methyl-D-erythritol 4-phosphate cytidylyltransferase [Endomicrobiales bacterium]
MSKTNKNFNIAIIVAGGKGLRLGGKTPKQFLSLGNKAVFLWSVIAFNKTNLFGQLIVVAPTSYHKKYSKLSKKYNFTFALSGDERINSVMSGLQKLKSSVKFVTIHDAARPFVSTKLICAIQIAAQKNGAAIAAIPAQDTVKYSKDGFRVSKTLSRANIWLAQTPQTFKRELIENAYKKNKNFEITDDASAVESIGIKPVLILGEKNNFKITTKEDMLLAKIIAAKRII